MIIFHSVRRRNRMRGWSRSHRRGALAMAGGVAAVRRPRAGHGRRHRRIRLRRHRRHRPMDRHPGTGRPQSGHPFPARRPGRGAIAVSAGVSSLGAGVHGGELGPAGRRQDLWQERPDDARHDRSSAWPRTPSRSPNTPASGSARPRSSWSGTRGARMLGLHVIKQRPDLFYAYVGAGQPVSWALSLEGQEAWARRQAAGG